jgi:hypothetical protein
VRRGHSEAVRGETLAAYLEGEVTPSEAAAIERTLADSAAARRRLEELRSIRDALARPVLDLNAPDLALRVRRAIQGGAPGSSRRAVGPWARRAGLIAVAAGLVVIAGIATLRHPAEPFRAKGAGSTDSGAERWAGIQVFRVDHTGKPERATERLRAGDGLLFSYTNVGPRPFDYVMIFGVDAQGDVRWFHPAYESAGANPTSIPAARGEANVPLAETIHHDFAPGPLAIYALFTMRPLQVLEVEALVRARRGSRLPLASTEAAQPLLMFRVEP